MRLCAFSYEAQEHGYPEPRAGTRCARRRPVAVIRLTAKLCQTPTTGLTAQQTTSTEEKASVTSAQSPVRPAERHDAATARRGGCQRGRSRRRAVSGAERCDGPAGQGRGASSNAGQRGGSGGTSASGVSPRKATTSGATQTLPRSSLHRPRHTDERKRATEMPKGARPADSRRTARPRSGTRPAAPPGLGRSRRPAHLVAAVPRRPPPGSRGIPRKQRERCSSRARLRSPPTRAPSAAPARRHYRPATDTERRRRRRGAGRERPAKSRENRRAATSPRWRRPVAARRSSPRRHVVCGSARPSRSRFALGPASGSARTSAGARAEPGEGLRAAPARRCRFHGARRAHAAPRLARGETAPGCGRGEARRPCDGTAVPSALRRDFFQRVPHDLCSFRAGSCRAVGLGASGLMQERHFVMLTAGVFLRRLQPKLGHHLHKNHAFFFFPLSFSPQMKAAPNAELPVSKFNS